MTCIVGFTKNKKVYIGADSAGISGWDLRIRKDKKVFKKGNMIFGFTGSFRINQIIQFSFVIPKQPKGKTDFEYMCSDFVDELRKVFKEKGWSTIKENVETGGTFLVGYKGEIYQIQEDFQVVQSVVDFDSCGIGDSYAKAAMAILVENDQISPEEKIMKALEIAEKFSAGVRGPFTVLSL